MGRRAACCDESAPTAGGGKRTEETGVWKEDATHPSKKELKKGMYFSADESEFLFVLSKHRVQYLIVGGEAVIYYGHARLTGDIDMDLLKNKRVAGRPRDMEDLKFLTKALRRRKGRS
jgi:hypothetical protein